MTTLLLQQNALILSHEKLRDVISSNSVPANNFPVVFPSKPQEESSKETQEKYENLNGKKA